MIMSAPHARSRVRKDDDEIIIDPVYHALSRINGDINRMTKPQLQHHLNSNGLNEKGVKEVLMKRLKNYYKKQKLHMKPSYVEGMQHYPYLVVLDYEATCEQQNPQDYLHEIIEFPAVLIDTTSTERVDVFHSYCKPALNPQLSEFCTSLTGIQQSDVDSAPDFTTVFNNFETWMKKHDLFAPRKCAFVTDGPWDFSRFLNIQCCLSEIKYPRWAKKWINLKKVYGNFYKLKKPKMMDMLSNIGLEFEGRHHCGMDDATNLSRIVQRMLDDGAIFQFNERLNSGKLEVISEKEKALLSSYDDANADVTEATAVLTTNLNHLHL
nr:3'-5' exoribonuclease 1-like [Ciona intestinalis]|eukprot:XP_002130965.1 3'-5' exoribonuclease 1-like [Ciona intestinalis]